MTSRERALHPAAHLMRISPVKHVYPGGDGLHGKTGETVRPASRWVPLSAGTICTVRVRGLRRITCVY